MELYRSIILILPLASAAFAQSIPGFEDKSIQQFLLDDHAVYDIKIAKDEVTTLAFPGPITALEGANVSNDPKQSPAPVLLSYQEGRYYFSVRAVTEKASASLNVIYKKQTYVLSLRTDKEPLRSVTFFQTQDEDGPEARRGQDPLSPTKLLSLIDRAKAHHVIRSQHPELTSQIKTAAPNQKMLYKGFDVVLAEVFRFDPEDTLVFKVLFFNNSREEICYQPQSLAVRVGSRVYYASLSDASGVMPGGILDPKSGQINPNVSIGYFAITGTPEGSRNNLSTENQFNVLVRRIPQVLLNR